jgi:hypothetical protein
MKSEVYKIKADTRDEMRSRVLDAAVCVKKREDQLRRKHAIFGHELQSALRLTVGFFEHLLSAVTTLSFKH